MLSFTLKPSAASLYLRRRERVRGTEGGRKGEKAFLLPVLPICFPFSSFWFVRIFVFYLSSSSAASPSLPQSLEYSLLPFLPPIRPHTVDSWDIFLPLSLIQARSPERLLDQIGLIKAAVLTTHYFPISSSISTRLLGWHCKPG